MHVRESLFNSSTWVLDPGPFPRSSEVRFFYSSGLFWMHVHIWESQVSFIHHGFWMQVLYQTFWSPFFLFFIWPILNACPDCLLSNILSLGRVWTMFSSKERLHIRGSLAPTNWLMHPLLYSCHFIILHEPNFVVIKPSLFGGSLDHLPTFQLYTCISANLMS